MKQKVIFGTNHFVALYTDEELEGSKGLPFIHG
jgi:hypothetical protein